LGRYQLEQSCARIGEFDAHLEHLADRAAMLAMRAMIAVQPPADLGLAGVGEARDITGDFLRSNLGR
jgi:hypothetical protein